MWLAVGLKFSLKLDVILFLDPLPPKDRLLFNPKLREKNGYVRKDRPVPYVREKRHVCHWVDE